MAQINHVFGKSLEFSTTVRDGKIVSQELVSSNDDCIISFKLDSNFLCPAVLRDLAKQISATKKEGLKLATSEQAQAYISEAKSSIDLGLFSSVSTASSAIAEYMANQDGLTLYSARVTPVAPLAVYIEDDDLDDADEEYADYEDDEDDEYDEDDEDDEDFVEDEDGDEDEDDEDTAFEWPKDDNSNESKTK